MYEFRDSCENGYFYNKVECAFPMVISSEFRYKDCDHHRDSDHQDGAPLKNMKVDFIKTRAIIFVIVSKEWKLRLENENLEITRNSTYMYAENCRPGRLTLSTWTAYPVDPDVGIKKVPETLAILIKKYLFIASNLRFTILNFISKYIKNIGIQTKLYSIYWPIRALIKENKLCIVYKSLLCFILTPFILGRIRWERKTWFPTKFDLFVTVYCFAVNQTLYLRYGRFYWVVNRTNGRADFGYWFIWFDFWYIG